MKTKFLITALGIAFYHESFALNENLTTSAQSTQETVVNSLKTNEVDEWSEWGLTKEEWSRFVELKKGSRGVWSPNLDPLTTLGIEARTDAEREHYAELLAKKEYQRVEKEIAFQLAYDNAFKRLYPNELPFRVDGQTANTPATSGRVIYFTKTDCDSLCENNFSRLREFAQNTPIDIYIVDSKKDDNKIRQWAVKNKIDAAKVRSRQITLNHDNGYWVKYAKGKMPAAFQIQDNGEWKNLAY